MKIRNLLQFYLFIGSIYYLYLINGFAIEGFKKALKRGFSIVTKKVDFNNELEPFPIKHVDHLCLDMNEILHRVYKNDYYHTIYTLWNRLNSTILGVNPKKSVVFAFDGPAPYAKLLLQRKRRIDPNDERNAITPGSSFMNSMEAVILQFILTRLHRPEYANLTYFISSPNIPGEGELKIVNWIRCHMPTQFMKSLNYPYSFINDTVVVYGGDSDIIVQGLSVSRYVKNLYIFQGKSFNKGELIYIPTILHEFANKFSANCSSSTNNGTNSHNITNLFEMYQSPYFNQLIDVMLISLWLGNDYLPKLKTFQFQNGFDVYQQLVHQFLHEAQNNRQHAQRGGKRSRLIKNNNTTGSIGSEFRLLYVDRQIRDPSIPFSDFYSLSYNIPSLYSLMKNLYVRHLMMKNKNVTDPNQQQQLEQDANLDVFSPTTLLRELCAKRKWSFAPDIVGPIPVVNSTPISNVNYSMISGVNGNNQTLYTLEILPFVNKQNSSIPIPWPFYYKEDYMSSSPESRNTALKIGSRYQLTGNEKNISNFILLTSSLLPDWINRRQWKNLVSLLILKLFYPSFYEPYIAFLQDLSQRNADHDIYLLLAPIIKSIQPLPMNCSDCIEYKRRYQHQVDEMEKDCSNINPSIGAKEFNFTRQNLTSFKTIGDLSVEIYEKFSSIFVDSPAKNSEGTANALVEDDRESLPSVASPSKVKDLLSKLNSYVKSESNEDEVFTDEDDYEDDHTLEEELIEKVNEESTLYLEEEEFIDANGLSNQEFLEAIFLRGYRHFRRSEITASPDDVASYLKGFLWVVEMYLHGKCLDNAYSYHSAAPSIRQVIEWIESYARNQSIALKILDTQNSTVESLLSNPLIIEKFQEVLQSPRSTAPPLTSDAVCVSVNRKTIKGIVPDHLTDIWNHANDHILKKERVKTMPYTTLISELEEYLKVNHSLPVSVELNNASTEQISSKMMKVTHPLNHAWKVIGRKDVLMNRFITPSTASFSPPLDSSLQRYRGKLFLKPIDFNKLPRFAIYPRNGFIPPLTDFVMGKITSRHDEEDKKDLEKKPLDENTRREIRDRKEKTTRARKHIPSQIKQPPKER